jgi:hypothetical protein
LGVLPKTENEGNLEGAPPVLRAISFAFQKAEILQEFDKRIISTKNHDLSTGQENLLDWKYEERYYTKE